MARSLARAADASLSSRLARNATEASTAIAPRISTTRTAAGKSIKTEPDCRRSSRGIAGRSFAARIAGDATPERVDDFAMACRGRIEERGPPGPRQIEHRHLVHSGDGDEVAAGEAGLARERIDRERHMQRRIAAAPT